MGVEAVEDGFRHRIIAAGSDVGEASAKLLWRGALAKAQTGMAKEFISTTASSCSTRQSSASHKSFFTCQRFAIWRQKVVRWTRPKAGNHSS